ncbi:Conserved hypothetical protein [Clostridium kluyveri DSM 555]|uniref:Uncharacterized protein n=1 Tax=Clostridium kluyveri (strain ATCC 8527 / DSM 555 / NBRC 12016 / NCIMB 10680 / K1) TaxID=431943 RepID=A5N0E1_CLOK5|nr:Conserved hypothetical protein [Clostridium kluyveri DSM 555]
MHYPLYEKYRVTKCFPVEDSCIGCGYVGKYQAVSIKIQAGRSVWIRIRHIALLECLNCYPKFVIHYEKKTQKT